jgi:hypothetical protein
MPPEPRHPLAPSRLRRPAIYVAPESSSARGRTSRQLRRRTRIAGGAVAPGRTCLPLSRLRATLSARAPPRWGRESRPGMTRRGRSACDHDCTERPGLATRKPLDFALPEAVEPSRTLSASALRACGRPGEGRTRSFDRVTTSTRAPFLSFASGDGVGDPPPAWRQLTRGRRAAIDVRQLSTYPAESPRQAVTRGACTVRGLGRRIWRRSAFVSSNTDFRGEGIHQFTVGTSDVRLRRLVALLRERRRQDPFNYA